DYCSLCDEAGVLEGPNETASEIKDRGIAGLTPSRHRIITYREIPGPSTPINISALTAPATIHPALRETMKGCCAGAGGSGIPNGISKSHTVSPKAPAAA